MKLTVYVVDVTRNVDGAERVTPVRFAAIGKLRTPGEVLALFMQGPGKRFPGLVGVQFVNVERTEDL